MLFRALGQGVRRFWYLILIAWFALWGATLYLAPSWDEVAKDREFAFLPANLPSVEAEKLDKEVFPDDYLSSNIVLVLHRPDHGPGMLERDKKFIENILEPRLRKIAKEEGGLVADSAPKTETPLFGEEGQAETKKTKTHSIMARIHTPNAPFTGDLLVSPDRRALLIVIELTTEFLSADNWPTIAKIQHLIEQVKGDGTLPSGLDIALTGSAVIGQDQSKSELQSAHATERWTIILVVGLLIVIYRAPLLALIPLVTVFMTVQIALHFLAILADWGFITLFQGIQIFITILAYGAGVDYSLFLTARYREELDRGETPGAAVATAVGDIGGVLIASACTVTFGIGTMIFAQFGKFQQAGYAIPISLILVFSAVVTFTPSLLLLTGRWAFWPFFSELRPNCDEHLHGWWLIHKGGLACFWDRMGKSLLRRPELHWLGTFAVMLPFAIFAGYNYSNISYDPISNLPDHAVSVEGTQVLQDHFPAGMIGTTTALLIGDKINFADKEGRALIAHITQSLLTLDDKIGLADVRSLTSPLGSVKTTTVSTLENVSTDAKKEETEHESLLYYITGHGQAGHNVTRFDIVMTKNPFSHDSIRDLAKIDDAIKHLVPAGVNVHLIGPTASVRDLATVIRGDRFRIEALVLSSALIILIVLFRSFIVPFYLLLSVLFSYFTTLGVTFAFFMALDPQGFVGLDWKVTIFLFTILIAVGEDYNIFLLSRVHEEQRTHGPLLGITKALDRTGPIISSCGLIMAGTFASLVAGSLNEMKQLGFALAFGVLLDTFIVRTLLVPAFLILLENRKPEQVVKS